MFDSLLLVGIFISLLAGQFARIELINALANVYIHEFIILVFIFHSLFQFGIQPIRSILRYKSVSSFCILLFVSFIISIREFTVLQNSVAFMYFMRLALYTVFGIYLFELMRRIKTVRFFLAKLITIFSVLLLIITAIQFIFYPNFWGLYKFGWDPHLYRASAIYLDVFVAAAIYGLLAFFWYIKKQNILSFLFIVALVLSFSRSAYIAFMVSILYFFMAQKKWKELVILLSLFVLFIIFVPKPFGEGGNLFRTSSINSRIIDYKLGVSLWEKKPILGYGYNRIRFAKEQLQLIAADDRSHSLSAFHSSFLVLLVTTGGIGFLSCIVLIFSLFRRYPAMRVFLVYILMMSLFDNVLLHALVLLPFLFLTTQLNQSSLE